MLQCIFKCLFLLLLVYGNEAEPSIPYTVRSFINYCVSSVVFIFVEKQYAFDYKKIYGKMLPVESFNKYTF